MTDKELELFDRWKSDNKSQNIIETRKVLFILVGISLLANLAQIIWKAPKSLLILTWFILLIILICINRLNKLKDKLVDKENTDSSHVETFKLEKQVQKNVFSTDTGMYIKIGDIYNDIQKENIVEGKTVIGIRTYANTYDIVHIE